MMQQNKPVYYEMLERSELLPCLGDGVGEQWKSRIVSTGLKDIIVQVTEKNDTIEEIFVGGYGRVLSQRGL